MVENWMLEDKKKKIKQNKFDFNSPEIKVNSE